MMKDKPVRIDWVDSCYTGGWQRGNNYENEPSQCITYGVIVKRNRTALTICQSISPNGYSEAMTIPRSVIKKITPLKET